jgi:2-polyprenyl-3-methyl-5-hydroxy-6-metoxy-1,4-benzoquinol methylase
MPPCPICNGQRFHKLTEKDRYGIPQGVAACIDCGLVQSRPRMDEKSYSLFYNSEYRCLYSGNSGPTRDFFNHQVSSGKSIINFLSKKTPNFFDAPENKRVIEVGCGAGGILYPFKIMGFKTIGFDLGEQYLSFGKEHYDLDLRNKAFNPDNVVGKADLIIYNHVLEHIPNLIDELKCARAALSEEGLLYIAVPGIKWLFFSYDMDFLKFLQNAHVWHFSLTTLKNCCDVSGFKLLHGDEKIRIIATPADSMTDYVNDYHEVIAFLQGLEIKRRQFAYQLFSLLQKLDSALPYKVSYFIKKLPLRQKLINLVSKQ